MAKKRIEREPPEISLGKLERYILSLLSDGKVRDESDIWMDINTNKGADRGLAESNIYGQMDNEFKFPPEQVERAISSLYSKGLIIVTTRPIKMEDKDGDIISYNQRWCWISNAGKSGKVDKYGDWKRDRRVLR